MKQTMSFPLYQAAAEPFGGWQGLSRCVRKLGLHGLEGIWGGTDIPNDLPKELVVGYHLTFYPDWLDLYLEDREALVRKFGSMETVAAFYGCTGREGLLELYRQDLQRAVALGAEYVVFHVSDVSIEEGYTYRWLHSDEAVIDASAEVVNALLREVKGDFLFLMENQWWAGFTFTDPIKTARLLEHVVYSNAGILLDTGHLMNTCPALRTQAEGADYIKKQMHRHGSLLQAVRGVHLHQSLSGSYVQSHTGVLPPLEDDYLKRFGSSYAHILQIDRHEPWTDPAICQVLQELSPDYITHELSGSDKTAVVAQQMETLCRGGLIKKGGLL